MASKFKSALAGVAQWIELQIAKQRVGGSIPSQGTCLGAGRVRGNHTMMFLSLPFSLLPLSLKINKILKIKINSHWAILPYAQVPPAF